MKDFANKVFSWLEKNQKEIVAAVCVFVVVLEFFILGMAVYSRNKGRQSPAAQEDLKPIVMENPQDYYNLALLGYGGPGHEGGSLSDVIKVIHVNTKKNTVAVISIPRDLWVEIPIRSDKKQYDKINASLAIGSDDAKYPLKEPQYKGEHGGGEMVKKVLESVIGMKVDYYASIDFSQFTQAIDQLGGVEVDVPVTFDDYFYPVKGLENEPCGKSGAEIARLTEELSGFQLEKQFECRYEHLHFDKGVQEMDGETALKFVRSRHSDQHGGDFARAQRQFALLLAIKDKLIKEKTIADIEDFFAEFSDIVKTDVEAEFLMGLLTEYPRVVDAAPKEVILSDQNVLVATKGERGQFILIPKEGFGLWQGVQNYVISSLSQ